MKKILLIDDESTFREAMGTVLRHNGYEVMDAPDGLAGVKIARTNKPDLVISDIVMDPVDGYMTLSILRQQPDTSRIPCVLVTGNGEPGGVRKGMVLGADDYLNKPFTPDELLQTVGNLIKRRNASLEAAAEQVNRLRSLLSAPLDGPINETVSTLSGGAAQLSAVAEEDQNLQNLSEEMFGATLRLQREIQRSLVLSQIEVVAGNPDATEVLRRAEKCTLAETVDTELRRIAKIHRRSSDIQTNLQDAPVQIGSRCLARALEEIIENAFEHSPANSPVNVYSSSSEQDLLLVIENDTVRRELRGVKDPEETTMIRKEPDLQVNESAGLQFASRLIEIHGGRLSVKQRSNHRVSVYINLPIAATNRDLN